MSRSFALLSFQLFCVVIIAEANSAQNYYVLDLEGYTPHSEINVAYKVYTEKRTWHDAKLKCIEDGSTLAIIDTYEKVQHIAALKGFNVYVWIGVSRSSISDSWMSAGSNSQMENLPWAPGKPYGAHNCLTVRGCNRGLSNENCGMLLGFVCQKPMFGIYERFDLF